MEDYVEKLDKLLALKKEKGHKINKKETEEYKDAWFSLIQAEGSFTPVVEKYFYNGFIFVGASPFVQWMLQTENPFEALQSLMKGQMFGKDTSMTFRVLINVLAWLLESKLPDNNLLCPVIKAIPAQSKNKEKKTIGDAHKIFLKYFADELNTEVTYPAIATLNIKPIFVRDFSALMDELLVKLRKMDLSKKQMNALAGIVAWVHPDQFTTESEVVKVEKPENSPIPKYVDGVKPLTTENSAQDFAATKNQQDDTQAITAKEPNAESKHEPIREIEADPYMELAETLKQASETITQLRTMALKTERNSAIECASNKREIGALKARLEEQEKRLDLLNAQIVERNNQIASLTLQIKEMEKNSEAMQSVISIKEVEIAERTQMIDALRRDREKQAEEQMTRLASKLKIDYMDFKDAEGLEMSVDLGENMRDQLKGVFDILKKAGIALD